MNENLLALGLSSFTTFFATIGPLDVAIIFLALTGEMSARERLRIAFRGALLGFVILLVFAFSGKVLLDSLGVSFAALRTAGGILLLLIAIDLVFARPSGATTATEDEKTEAASSEHDITVFPLATPLIAGPGAIGAVIILMTDAHGDYHETATVLAAMFAVILLTFILMLAAVPLQRIIGQTGAQVIARVFGVLLAALAVQFVFDGIAESGLLVSG